MSPEQVEGKSVDARSDVFSFGVVLYELLSGKRAFAGETVLDVLNAVVHDEPRPLETPPEVQSVVMRCLNKEPAKRFQSMAEVKEALTRVQIHKPRRQPSIAVLPFANLSGDIENEYFCEGLTEEIINQLGQIPGLRVTARTSVFVFQKRKEDIRKIAATLDVQTVLEGSVRESGTRLRVTAQLINATDGYHLGSRDLKIEHASSILRPGQSDELQFHVIEGNSGNLLGAKTLGHWIHVKRMPNPLNVVTRCNSVNSKAYSFRFICMSHLGKLRITYEGSAADGELSREPELIAG